MPILTEAERAEVEAIELVMSGHELSSRVRVYETLLQHARRDQANEDDEIAGWLGMSPDVRVKRDEGYG